MSVNMQYLLNILNVLSSLDCKSEYEEEMCSSHEEQTYNE